MGCTTHATVFYRAKDIAEGWREYLRLWGPSLEASSLPLHQQLHVHSGQHCVRLNLYFDVSEEAMVAYDLLAG